MRRTDHDYGEGECSITGAHVVELTVPRRWKDITPAWVTTAFRARHPEAVASRVEVIEIDRGSTTRARLGVEYATGDGPETVFLKIQGSLSHRLVVTLWDLLEREGRVYSLHEPMPVEMPFAYGVGVDRRILGSVLLLEDVTRRATINYAADPLGVASVGHGLDQLARLHARFWNYRSSANPALHWIHEWRLTRSMALMWRLGSHAGVRRARELVPEALLAPQLRDGEHLTALCARYVASLRLGPQTLLHGDTHVGNTYRLPDGRVGFYDWQVVSSGSWVHDVGFFMVSAMSIEDRRTHERDLIERYLDGLREAGVSDPPSMADAWHRYRCTPPYGLQAWMVTLGFRSYQTTENTVASVARFATAAMDLESERALQDLPL